MSQCSECGKNYTSDDVLRDESKLPSREEEIKKFVEEIDHERELFSKRTGWCFQEDDFMSRAIKLIKNLGESL